jgi:hypothetical protein
VIDFQGMVAGNAPSIDQLTLPIDCGALCGFWFALGMATVRHLHVVNPSLFKISWRKQ